MKMPETPPKWQDLMTRNAANVPALLQSSELATFAKSYYHWDELKYRPLPSGFSREEVWLALKLRRVSSYRALSLADGQNQPFVFSLPDELLRRLQELDDLMARSRKTKLPFLMPSAESRFMAQSLLEESISSSLLEGAPTTHEKAREMFLKKSTPQNVGEQMVWGAHHAMEEICRDVTSPLTMERLLFIHRLFTEKTLVNEAAAGRFRLPQEKVRVADGEGHVFHVPPAEGERLQARVQHLLDFVNGTDGDPQTYVPPLVRAIVVHFAFAYEHPFVDGNGRMARALMYWSLLHEGYRPVRSLSISEIIRRAPAQYARAFLFVETDANDLTYFLLHQTEVLLAAFAQLEASLQRTEEMPGNLSRRQQQIVRELQAHPHREVSIAGYCDVAHVSYATARADLIDLEQKQILSSHKDGHARIYRLRSARNVDSDFNRRILTL